MILSAIKYTRYAGAPREWSIIGKDDDYAYFGNINLLVGKNASGKSRTLNVIREIASLLSGKIDLKHIASPTESFELIFTEGKTCYKYILEIKEREVSTEILYLDNKVLLDKNKGIIANTHGEKISVDIQNTQLLITQSGSDGKPYFKDLVSWGQSLHNYLFANQLEKSRLVKDYTKIIEEEEQDVEGSDVLIYTFYKGRKDFGDAFVSEVISCMRELGYYVSDIDIQEKRARYGLIIEEEGKYTVSQREMSQGMFRALSLFIMMSYARLNDLTFCLLIDDMGEGIDFERSKKMMEIVIKKINRSNIQFFMTSNDRNIMNQIPLRFWTVIGRENNKSVFYDYTNSKENFDDFKYTGLNNFDFLATDFYCKGFGIIDEDED